MIKMGRTPCCGEEGLKKGAWTADEDQKLIAYIQKHGEGGWRTLPQKAGLRRCGKSCRLRWTNYLNPDIKRGEISAEEEEAIIQLHAIKGNKWSAIASRLPGRTDNEIKNYWNTHLKKRLIQKGIDPVTHKSISIVVNPLKINSDDAVGNTSDKASPSQSSSSRSTSVSAQLLNRVATKLSITVNHAALSKIIAGGGSRSGNTNGIGFSNNEPHDIDSPTLSLSSSDNQSKISGWSTSTSRLLNKMAINPSTMLKAILLKKEAESSGGHDSFDVDMGINSSVEYPITSKSTSSLSDHDSIAPSYSMDHDGTGDLDLGVVGGCYDMGSNCSVEYPITSKSTSSPSDDDSIAPFYSIDQDGTGDLDFGVVGGCYDMGINCSVEYPITSKSTSSPSDDDSIAPFYGIDHDGSGDLDFGVVGRCYNMSKINFLKDTSASSPDDHQQFRFAEFLEKLCEGEINDDELVTNMGFDSVEGLSHILLDDPNNCQSIIGPSMLEDTLNSGDDLDLENFGVLLDSPMF